MILFLCADLLSGCVFLFTTYTFIWSSLIFGTLEYSKRTVEFDESSFKNKPLNVMNTVDLFSVLNSDLVISGLKFMQTFF